MLFYNRFRGNVNKHKDKIVFIVIFTILTVRTNFARKEDFFTTYGFPSSVYPWPRSSTKTY